MQRVLFITGGIIGSLVLAGCGLRVLAPHRLRIPAPRRPVLSQPSRQRVHLPPVLIRDPRPV